MPHKDKAAAKEYQRRYHAERSQERNAQKKDYREANKEKILAREQSYRETHRAEKSAYNQRYRAENRAELNEYDRERSKLPARKEAKRAYDLLYIQKNREQIYAKNRAKWPTEYARSRERRLAYARNKIVFLAGRPRPAACEICGFNQTRRPLAYDHCHQTGKFRGWICDNCNVALGMVRDNVDHLRMLIRYLQSHHSSSPSSHHLPQGA
jgi:hypothetical protein